MCKSYRFLIIQSIYSHCECIQIMSIESMISPTSIAVLGASNRKNSVGDAVMTNIISGGYAGKLYPVNPSDVTKILRI